MGAPTERLPYRATEASAPYEQISELPVVALLDNIRSLYNVGAFFRTADAARIRALHLCGITGQPPNPGISKTALGAERSVRWEYSGDGIKAIEHLRHAHYEIVAVETRIKSVDLFDWEPTFPVCLIFGNEIEGITPEVSSLADTYLRIPMLGVKHSLNVATAGGIVIYELLRKFRRLIEAS